MESNMIKKQHFLIISDRYAKRFYTSGLNNKIMDKMITISWYNVVAIVSLAVWLFWAGNGERDDYGFGALVKLVVGIIFILLWGGIFWW